jgi:hypothetical protein
MISLQVLVQLQVLEQLPQVLVCSMISLQMQVQVQAQTQTQE